MKSSDFLIIGAGPVGLTLALECCRHQIDFRIIDHHLAHSDKSKALVIWSGTLECLAAMGVVKEFIERGLPLRRLMLAAHGKILNDIPGLDQKIDSPYPQPLFLPQSETEQILERRLESFGKKVERGIDLVALSPQEDHVIVELRNAEDLHETLCVNYLAGCDGAHSLVRHVLPVEFEGETEPQRFVLIDAKVEGDLPQDGMFANWGKDYTVIFFPVKPGIFRMFTQRLDRTNTAPPTLEEMQGYLALVGLGHLRLYDPEWLSYFDINERYASRNRVGPVFLLGDAAHIHSPAGGQGMNTGMQDAFNLGWKLKFLIKGGGDSEIIAESYFQERHPVAKSLIQETTRLLHTGIANSFLAHLGKRFVGEVILRLPFFQKIFFEKLSEMNIHYPASGLLEHTISKKNKNRKEQVGWRVYETFVIDPQTKKTVSLWKEFLHPGHTLLIFAGDGLSKEESSLLTNLLSRIVHTDHDQEAATSNGVTCEAFSKTKMHLLIIARQEAHEGQHVDFLDPNHQAHQRFGITKPSWLLIRPDLYVAARGLLRETAALENYFRKLGVLVHSNGIGR
jgi:2-polyprenyl-6-methoxyphenol hydroxylase-like FAD-dependent oxidoreductase